jgi:hypothetical protein
MDDQNPFSDLLPVGVGSDNPFADLMPPGRAQQGASPLPNAPARPDPYAGLDDAHHQARQFLDTHPDAQPGVLSSMANKAGQGFTFGWGDEAAAGIRAGLGAIKDTVTGDGPGLSKRYELEKAMQDELLRRASDKTGGWGTAAEVAGGIGSGVGLGSIGNLARGVQGAGIVPQATRVAAGVLSPALEGQTALGRIGSSALQGTALGAVSGAGFADSGHTGEGALGGAVTGAVIGGAVPAAIELAKAGASPIISAAKAWHDPRGYAENQLARTIGRSGMTMQEVDDAIAAAHSSGQTNFTIADALGDAGQSQLAGIMKQPGAARSEAADWLAARNAGMGRNVAAAVDDAFQTQGRTAQQYTNAATNFRDNLADRLYPAAREGAQPVDLSNTMTTLEGLRDPAGVLPGGAVTRGQSPAPAGVERAANFLSPEGLGETTAADFSLVLDRKRQIGDLIGEAVRAGRNYEASQLMRVQEALDTALSTASPRYRMANDTFAQLSRPIDAAEVGKRAATTGRAADNIDVFNAMSAPERGGFRVGYADQLNQGLGGNQVGGRINEMLRGDVADEINRFAAPGRAHELNDVLRRSQTMIATGNKSLGGSPTAELLNSQADVGADAALGVLSNVASGNIPGALRQGVNWAGNRWHGNTEAVRNELIPMLLSTGRYGSSPVPVDLPQIVANIQQRTAASAARGDAFRRGVNSAISPAIVDAIARNDRDVRSTKRSPVVVQPTIATAGPNQTTLRRAPEPVVVETKRRR